jgi:hypothetical protein
LSSEVTLSLMKQRRLAAVRKQQMSICDRCAHSIKEALSSCPCCHRKVCESCRFPVHFLDPRKTLWLCLECYKNDRIVIEKIDTLIKNANEIEKVLFEKLHCKMSTFESDLD